MERLFGRESGLALDARRIEYLLQAELDLLLDSTTDRLPDAEEELRGLLFVWFARFLPEVVSREVRTRLRECVDEARSLEDYTVSHWERVLPFEAALYALERRAEFLTSIIGNLDHGSAGLRDRTMRCFAFIADLCSFSDADLQERVSSNLRSRHSHSEWIAVAALVTRGSARAKLHAVARWLSENRLDRDEQSVLSSIAETGYAPNPWFADMFLSVAHYAAVRLACSGRDVANTQSIGRVRQHLLPTLGDDATSEEFAGRVLDAEYWGTAPRATGANASALQDLKDGLFADQQDGLNQLQMQDYVATVWSRIRSHPLAQGYVRIDVASEEREGG